MADNEDSGFMSWLRGLFGRGGPVVPVVRLHGVIAAEHRPGRLNITTVGPLLKRAFAVKGAPVVAIVVNSPGGSPVQSRLISKRIRLSLEGLGSCRPAYLTVRGDRDSKVTVYVPEE